MTRDHARFGAERCESAKRGDHRYVIATREIGSPPRTLKERVTAVENPRLLVVQRDGPLGVSRRMHHEKIDCASTNTIPLGEIAGWDHSWDWKWCGHRSRGF